MATVKSEMSKNQIAHDLALLVVQNKMDNGKISLLGEIVEEYAQQYSDFSKVIDQNYSDLIK